jgi:hypothetical protein
VAYRGVEIRLISKPKASTKAGFLTIPGGHQASISKKLLGISMTIAEVKLTDGYSATAFSRDKPMPKKKQNFAKQRRSIIHPWRRIATHFGKHTWRRTEGSQIASARQESVLEKAVRRPIATVERPADGYARLAGIVGVPSSLRSEK